MTNFDVFRPESVFDTMRLARGLSTLGTLLVDQVNALDDHIIKLFLLTRCNLFHRPP